MRILREVRDDETARRKIASRLGYVGEACCECNEYTLRKEGPRRGSMSSLICKTCDNRQLPVWPGYGDDVHTIIPHPDGIQGLDLPLAERHDQLRRHLRDWLRSHIKSAKACMLAFAALCMTATMIFAWRIALHFAPSTAAELDLMLCGLAGTVVFFGIWYMLEVAGDRLSLYT